MHDLAAAYREAWSGLKQFYNEKVDNLLTELVGTNMEKPLAAVKLAYALVADAVAIVDGPVPCVLDSDNLQDKHFVSMAKHAELDAATDTAP